MTAGEERAVAPLGWPTYLLAALAFAVLVGLGTWQVKRLEWKDDVIATIEARRLSAPKPLAEVERQFAETGDVDYMPVALNGRFRHESEQHFFATWKGDTGYYVYTPLEMADGRTVLVNRGFVPFELKDAGKRAAGQVPGEVSVTGLARNPLHEKPSMMVPDNEPAKNIYYWKDMAAMAGRAGLDTGKLVPFFVDADAAPNPGGLPVGGVTLIDLPNSHLQYALTWYGLAGALVVVFGMFAWRRRSDARP